MTTATVEDPDEVDSFKVTDDGRVYLGMDYAGSTVELVVSVEEMPEERIEASA